MWYRKREEASIIAEQCDIALEFSVVGIWIHEDDIDAVQHMLGVTDDCMDLLFSYEEMACTD